MPPRISRILMRPMRADLTSMPDEILWQVCLLIDKLEVFAQVCRRFHLFSKSSTLRAQYLLRTYGAPYAMFYAIARPKIFNSALCQDLMDAGATLSLALVQELTKRYFSTGYARTEYAKKDRWCLNLSYMAAAYVVIKGAFMYSTLRLSEEYSEMELFLDWTTGRVVLSRSELDTMFLERQFAPLPLRMEQYKASYTKGVLSNVLENAATVSELLYAQLIHNSRKRKAPATSECPTKAKAAKF